MQSVRLRLASTTLGRSPSQRLFQATHSPPTPKPTPSSPILSSSCLSFQTLSEALHQTPGLGARKVEFVQQMPLTNSGKGARVLSLLSLKFEAAQNTVGTQPFPVAGNTV